MNDYYQPKAVSLGVKGRFSTSKRPFLYQWKAVLLGVCLLFPRWEYFIPKLGMFCSQGGKKYYCLISGEYCEIRACCWGISVAYFTKSLISPVPLLKSLCLKDFCVFISPLISPVISPLISPVLYTLLYNGIKIGINTCKKSRNLLGKNLQNAKKFCTFAMF